MLTATPAYATVTRSHKSPSCESHVRQGLCGFIFAKWSGTWLWAWQLRDICGCYSNSSVWLLHGIYVSPRPGFFAQNSHLVWLLRNGCTCRWRSVALCHASHHWTQTYCPVSHRHPRPLPVRMTPSWPTWCCLHWQWTWKTMWCMHSVFDIWPNFWKSFLQVNFQEICSM